VNRACGGVGVAAWRLALQLCCFRPCNVLLRSRRLYPPHICVHAIYTCPPACRSETSTSCSCRPTRGSASACASAAPPAAPRRAPQASLRCGSPTALRGRPWMKQRWVLPGTGRRGYPVPAGACLAILALAHLSTHCRATTFRCPPPPFHAMPCAPQMAAAGPLDQFDAWFKTAASCGLKEPNAMALATADGSPSVRYVLLKGYDDRGFVWYTNYDSFKVGGWVGAWCRPGSPKRSHSHASKHARQRCTSASEHHPFQGPVHTGCLPAGQAAR
jgi:hypothetical protein